MGIIDHITKADIECIKVYAECSMNRAEAASRLYMSRSAILYRFDRVKGRTGLDPRNFYDLVKLLEMFEIEEELKVNRDARIRGFVDEVLKQYKDELYKNFGLEGEGGNENGRNDAHKPLRDRSEQDRLLPNTARCNRGASEFFGVEVSSIQA